jgi:SAM-dependent methyltransferase
LVVGVPCLQETVAGVELQLPPVKNLWNTIHGAEMLCQALEELLAPSKKTTVLDIGCGIGLLGLYLSKVCIACSICLFVLKYCRGKLRGVRITTIPHLLLYNNYYY